MGDAPPRLVADLDPGRATEDQHVAAERPRPRTARRRAAPRQRAGGPWTCQHAGRQRALARGRSRACVGRRRATPSGTCRLCGAGRPLSVERRDPPSPLEAHVEERAAILVGVDARRARSWAALRSRTAAGAGPGSRRPTATGRPRRPAAARRGRGGRPRSRPPPARCTGHRQVAAWPRRLRERRGPARPGSPARRRSRCPGSRAAGSARPGTSSARAAGRVGRALREQPPAQRREVEDLPRERRQAQRPEVVAHAHLRAASHARGRPRACAARRSRAGASFRREPGPQLRLERARLREVLGRPRARRPSPRASRSSPTRRGWREVVRARDDAAAQLGAEAVGRAADRVVPAVAAAVAERRLAVVVAAEEPCSRSKRRRSSQSVASRRVASALTAREARLAGLGEVGERGPHGVEQPVLLPTW